MPEGERTMMSLSKAIKAQLGVDVSRSRLQEWRTKHLGRQAHPRHKAAYRHSSADARDDADLQKNQVNAAQ